jgi:hypothetical protein
MSSLSRIGLAIAPHSKDRSAEVQRAQRYVGLTMSTCLGCWFLPVVSGIVCSMAEAELINRVLKIMDCYSKEDSDRIYWFFRKKTFFLFAGTYAPFVGVPLQLFETYGLGQFAIHCALKPHLLQDDAWLESSWNEVSPDIFSGEHAIESYESFTGQAFPDYARKKFVVTVDVINTMYLASQRIPGAAKAQDLIGSVAQGAIGAAGWILKLAGVGTVISVVAVGNAGKNLVGAASKKFSTDEKDLSEPERLMRTAKLEAKALKRVEFAAAQERYNALKVARAARKIAEKSVGVPWNPD